MRGETRAGPSVGRDTSPLRLKGPHPPNSGRGLAVSERAAPQYCPYCGDEDLRPEVLSEDRPEASHGVWLCRACARVFKLSFVGLSGLSTAVSGRAVTDR